LLTSDPNPSSPNQEVAFKATVSSALGTPTGTVTFSEGSTTLGTESLNNGMAILNYSGLSEGEHFITAKYNGDSNFAPSISTTINQTVRPGAGGGSDGKVYLPMILR
jgi:hypothetical protein